MFFDSKVLPSIELWFVARPQLTSRGNQQRRAVFVEARYLDSAFVATGSVASQTPKSCFRGEAASRIGGVRLVTVVQFRKLNESRCPKQSLTEVDQIP